MDNNIITLHFRKDISRLAGNKLGEDTFEKQIKDNINYSKLNILVFPDEIENIAISFVQGLTKGIFDEINKDEFSRYFKVVAKGDLPDKFIKSIYF